MHACRWYTLFHPKIKYRSFRLFSSKLNYLNLTKFIEKEYQHLRYQIKIIKYIAMYFHSLPFG